MPMPSPHQVCNAVQPACGARDRCFLTSGMLYSLGREAAAKRKPLGGLSERHGSQLPAVYPRGRMLPITFSACEDARRITWSVLYDSRRPNKHPAEHRNPEVYMQDEELEAYFKFDEVDLQANRNGQFSEKQKHRFSEMDQSRRNGRVFAGIVFIGVAIAGPLVTLWLGVSVQNPLLTVLFGFFFGLVWPLLWGALGIYLLRTLSSKQKYKLGKVQGHISFSRHINTRTRNPVYGYLVLHVATKRFDVPENFPTIMKPGDEYLLYYITTAGTSKIISAALVEQAT
jgi:hypothetical protein